MTSSHATATRIPGRRFVHAPGPTHVPPEVTEAMSRQPMDMGDTRLDPIIAACEQGLKKLLHTRDADVFMYAANGHGAWEAAIANLLAPGRSVLVAGTGHFSEQWAIQTEALGAKVIRTPWVEGFPIDPNVIEAVLRADTVFASLGEAMRAGRWSEDMPTNLVLVSGPSKTADIELILAFGVHGPKELIVLIVE